MREQKDVEVMTRSDQAANRHCGMKETSGKMVPRRLNAVLTDFHDLNAGDAAEDAGACSWLWMMRMLRAVTVHWNFKAASEGRTNGVTSDGNQTKCPQSEWQKGQRQRLKGPC